jgi:3-hydroxyacyl-[acyl-carrier-protein] dehydratase
MRQTGMLRGRRAQFLLIDRLIELTPSVHAAAETVFHEDEEVFAGHFPGFPLVPGVLLTEAMGQTGGWLIAATVAFADWPVLVMIRRAKFYRPVRPGDPLRLEASLRGRRGRTFEIRAAAFVRGERVAAADLVFQTVSPSHVGDGADRLSRWARDTFAALGGQRLAEAGGAP